MKLTISDDKGNELYTEMLAQRGFTTGSIGYNAAAKINVDGVPHQVTFNAIQVGSKLLSTAASVATKAQQAAKTKADARTLSLKRSQAAPHKA